MVHRPAARRAELGRGTLGPERPTAVRAPYKQGRAWRAFGSGAPRQALSVRSLAAAVAAVFLVNPLGHERVVAVLTFFGLSVHRFTPYTSRD
jgi:hypothetical protein